MKKFQINSNCSKKKFTIIEIILMIITFIIISKSMRYFLEKHSDPNKDPANKTLFSLSSYISICIWNFIHIIVYFILCIIIDARLCIDRHLFVFIIGIAWYLIVPMLTLPVEGVKNKKNNRGTLISYSDTRIPMLSDFVFNTTGQLLYVIFFLFNK